MKITEIKTSELIPYARNQKKHTESQIKKIMASIKEFGFKQPVIIDKEKVIVAGHGRVLAAERLELEKVPCIIADDLTEEQIKAYRIADNKLNESEWNLDMLKLEMEELNNLNFDLELTGFENIGFEEEEEETEEKPEDFKEYDENLETEYCCPKCGYEWSGKAK